MHYGRRIVILHFTKNYHNKSSKNFVEIIPILSRESIKRGGTRRSDGCDTSVEELRQWE